MIRSKLIKKIGYKLLDIFCKNGISVKINGFSLRLPVYYFRLFPSDYEKENFEFIRRSIKEGHVVLDIGAHIGLTAAIFGNMVKEHGRVFSFEPTASSFATLKETIRINGLQNIVTPVNMPVTEKSGKVNFFVSDSDTDVANSLVEYEEHKILHAIQLDATSIDDFVSAQNLTRVDFVKIDAEGAELNVLKGGAKTFATFKPLIILALHPEAINAIGHSLLSIYEVVKTMGFKIYFGSTEMSSDDFCNRQGLFDVHLTTQ